MECSISENGVQSWIFGPNREKVTGRKKLEINTSTMNQLLGWGGQGQYARTRRREMRYTHMPLLFGNRNERNGVEDLDVEGKVILKFEVKN
jgi:hypothetical protein